jgi:hypothetical protein
MCIALLSSLFSYLLCKTVSFILQLCAGDGLPAQVCQQCVHQVNSFYNFKLQCEKSDLILQQFLSCEQSENQPCQVSLAVVIDVIYITCVMKLR